MERAFGVLQARFNIMRRPAPLWSLKTIRNIMKACIILHNMIVEDEGEMAERNIDLKTLQEHPLFFHQKWKKAPPVTRALMMCGVVVRARPIHAQLKNDLVEHIWQRSHNERRRLLFYC